jgi:hypothetical protein
MNPSDIVMLKFTIRYGEMDTLQEETTVHFLGKWLFQRGGYEMPWFGKQHKIDQPTIERILCMIHDCDVLMWETEYFAPVLHGTSWVLVMTCSDDVEIIKKGFNAFPNKWNDFHKALHSLSEHRSDCCLIPLDH